MRVAAVQHDIVWERPEENFARLAPLIAAAAAADARLVVVSETFSTGFSMRTDVTAEPPGGPSAEFLAGQAKEHGVWVCGTYPEQPDGVDRPYNTLLLAGPDGEQHRYRKIHPFTYGGEREHFSAGSDFLTVEVEGVRCTFFVCYDLRFADEFWATAEQTDCYVVPANWPKGRRRHWQTLLQARAVENQAYAVGCNRIGEGGGLLYSGDSCVVDPMGEVLVTASQVETVLVADVDAERVRETRTRFPFFEDRR